LGPRVWFATAFSFYSLSFTRLSAGSRETAAGRAASAVSALAGRQGWVAALQRTPRSGVGRRRRRRLPQRQTLQLHKEKACLAFLDTFKNLSVCYFTTRVWVAIFTFLIYSEGAEKFRNDKLNAMRANV